MSLKYKATDNLVNNCTRWKFARLMKEEQEQNNGENMINKRKSKRGQEEMVGFVLIIVLVAVIVVVFLGLSIRNKKDVGAAKGIGIGNFLSAASHYTTDCESPETKFKEIQEVAIMCYEEEMCEGSIDPCVVLREDFEKMLENSYLVADGSYIKDYKMEVFFGQNTTFEQLIGPISVNSLDSCSGRRVFDERAFDPGYSKDKIFFKLEVCYSD